MIITNTFVTNQHIMKKILLPTDFSENAHNAIKYAVQLFKDEETTFYLLNTYTPAIYQAEYLIHSPGHIGLGDVYRESSQTQLKAHKTKIENEFNNHKHTFILHSAFNILIDEVEETIKNENVDMIIMGTQGATGAKEILFGTNTVHVIKKATCPVIAIPSGFKYESPKEILFPTDYEIDYKKEQLKELLEMAKKHSAKIEVMHVTTSYELSKNQIMNKQKLNHILSQTPHLFDDLENQELITAIDHVLTKKGIDLLVMVQNKHTFIERLFIEPTIKMIGFHISIPFMVIPYYK